MDLGDHRSENGFDGDSYDLGDSRPQKQLPSDLPTSLNDRRHTPQVFGETELYDGWQGM